MTEKEIDSLSHEFNDSLIKKGSERKIKPSSSNEKLVLLIDECLTSLCKKYNYELRKFVFLPGVDEESGKKTEIEASFLVTDLKGLSVQFELSDIAELQGSRISRCLVTEEEFNKIKESIFPANNIDSPITKEWIKARTK